MVSPTPIAVPSDTPYRKLTPSVHSPSSAMHTVVPANSTARPEVFTATTIDSSTGMPRSRLRRCRVTMNSA